MDQQQKDISLSKGPLSEDEYATQIQTLFRGFLLRKDYLFDCKLKSASSRIFPMTRLVIQNNPVRRFPSHVSALTVEDFSERSLCTYQEDLLVGEHPGFEGNGEGGDFSSPIRIPKRIASKESTSSSFFFGNGMRTVQEDDEHPGFDSPNAVEEAPIKRPTRYLSKESIDSSNFLDKGNLLFSPNTVNATCVSSGRKKKGSVNLAHLGTMPFSRGVHETLTRRERPKDRPALIPIRHRSDAS